MYVTIKFHQKSRDIRMFLMNGRSVYIVLEMIMNDTASVARITRWGWRNKGRKENDRETENKQRV